MLKRVHQGQAATLVSQTQQIWKPTRELLSPYFTTQEIIPSGVISRSQDEMLRNNLQVLDLMNRLTSILQQDSLNRANTLRVVQTIVFFLALINFLAIVRKFHLLALQSHQAKEHFSELAVRDSLTGLFNRREFDTNLKREIGAVSRHSQEKFAIVMIDLDGFKPINDKFGHKAGDIVLKTVATRLAEHARATDTVARIGGDEFALICTTLHDEEDAAKFCDRLLNSISDPIVLEVGEIQVGASIGIVFYPNHTNSDHDLMHMADDAMYAAKRAGRNRYIFFRES